MAAPNCVLLHQPNVQNITVPVGIATAAGQAALAVALATKSLQAVNN